MCVFILCIFVLQKVFVEVSAGVALRQSRFSLFSVSRFATSIYLEHSTLPFNAVAQRACGKSHSRFFVCLAYSKGNVNKNLL